MRAKVWAIALSAAALSICGVRQGCYAFRAHRDRNAAKAPEVLQEAPKPLDIDTLEKSREQSAIPVN